MITMKRTMVRVFAFTIFIAFSWGVAKAQTTAPHPDAAQANASYLAKDWARAAELYGHITEAEPKNGRAWYRLGVSLHGEGEHEQATKALEKSIENGAANFLAEYEIALCYASLKRDDKTREYLERAVQDGFGQPELMMSDMELSAMRSEASFQEIIEQAKRNQSPCTYATENRQFDFWVGDWNVVTSKGGMPAGTSKIERILNDCVILENWTSLNNPYQGKSYNTYNTSLKRWEQFWVDNSQGMIHFYGELKDGIMDYWTEEIPQGNGQKLKRHLQFIPQGPDRVRQFSQGSTDGGKTWSVEYDFTYNRVK
jgi:hypothetical protein